MCKDKDKRGYLLKSINMSIRELIVRDKENEVNEDMIEEILKTVFNTLMIKREIFMEEKEDKENKCNGYYRRMAKGITKYFKIKVLRDRLGYFRPEFLNCIEEEEWKLMGVLQRLCKGE